MGRPKPWLPVAGEPLLARTARVVLAACPDGVVAVGSPGQELPALPGGCTVVRDRVTGRGPLEGLAAGLATLATRGEEVAYLTACDVPLLTVAFVQAVVARLGEADIAVPWEPPHHHPLAAAYRVATVRPRVEALLAAGRLRPVQLFDELRTVRIPVEELRAADPRLGSLRACNTTAEYEALLAEVDA
jgi:molybdopterin-guanine dinucleotide biosynthesis protein A